MDLTEQPAIYRNHNIRLVYLHMCLRCGWHDNDRDMIDTSVRRLSADVGISISAVRHALHILMDAQLIERQGTMFWVKKWQAGETISPRATEKAQKKATAAQIEREMAQRKRDKEQAEREREKDELEKQGKTSFMVWYEERERAAAAGDLDAKKTVERNRAVYESHKHNMEQLKTSKK